jgi:enediyne biosynthesis protein E7
MSPAVLQIPPGPAEPVELTTIRRDPLRFLTRMRSDYGDVTSHVLDERVYLVNRPDLARRVLAGNQRNYVKAGTPDDMMLTPLLGRGLLTSDGEVWKRQRRVSQPPFDRKRVETFDGLVTTATNELVDRWLAAGPAEPLRLDHQLSGLTLAIVGRAIFGSDLTGIDERFGAAVDVLNRFMGHYDPLEDSEAGREARASFGRAVGLLNGIVGLLIQARRLEGTEGRDDLLSTLIDGLGDESGAAATERELRDQIVTMLMAGHETTAKALTWTTVLLHGDPAVAGRLDDELRSVLGDRTATSADLPRLPYLTNVISEALRLYPPVWLLSRRAVVDDRLGEFDVPAGTLVCVSPYLLHRDERYWRDPETFDPDRFGEAESAGRPEYAYIPFSGGPRHCIGRHFALLEAQLVLATMRRRVRIELVEGHPIEPEALVTLRPRHGVLATVRGRDD